MALAFYCVDSLYCDYLRIYDKKVPYTMDRKEKRPFVGVVIEVGDLKYYAPLTSPKPKHLQMKNQRDFIKIKNGEYGAINLNNMIPVPERYLYPINPSKMECLTKSDSNYKNLIMNQLTWCNANKSFVLTKAKNLHEMIIQNKADDKLKQRCCDFMLLESICLKYDVSELYNPL